MPDLVEVKQGALEYRMLKKHTMFVSGKNFVPEDYIWRRDHPKTPPFVCLKDERVCDCPWFCVEKIARRCFYVFDKFPKLKMLVMMYRDSVEMIERKRVTVEHGEFKHWVDKVPKVSVMIIERDFLDSRQPYRLMNANYDGLNLLLKQTSTGQCDFGLDFWS